MKTNRFQILLTLLLFCVAGGSLHAVQAHKTAILEDTVYVKGNVIDAVNHLYLADVYLECLSLPDSVVVNRCHTYDMLKYNTDPERADIFERQYGKENLVLYSLRLPRGKYLFRFSRDGYAVQTYEVDLTTVGPTSSEEPYRVPKVELRRQRSTKLGEANVKATRIKMMARGDTVIYNADAFQLADGSMLDNLIEMLPGVELREGGRIYHNGEYVPELLVNGKDFFKGDPMVALQNLPAYTVKEVRIFHKAPDIAYLKKDTSKDTLNWNKAIDVRLKREYSEGWMANVELAYGPAYGNGSGHHKYVGKFFGIRTTDRSRLAMFANMNNTNDASTANRVGDWSSKERAITGNVRTEVGGVNLNLDPKNTNLKYNLEFKAQQEHTDREHIKSATTFLGDNDAYSRQQSYNTGKRISLSLDNDITHRGKNVFLYFTPKFDMQHDNSCNTTRNAEFADDPHDEYRGASIDSIFLQPGSQRLNNLLLNRYEAATLYKNTSWANNNNLSATIKLPFTDNLLSLYLFSNYSSNKSRVYEHYDLQYGNAATATPADHDYRNRYILTPRQRFNAFANATYSDNKKGRWFSYSLSYRYSMQYRFGGRAYYRLDHLYDDAFSNDLPLGSLPSTTDWREQAIDEANSYRMRVHNQEHEIRPSLSLRIGKIANLTISPNVSTHRMVGTDTRNIDGEVLRHYVFFKPSANISSSYGNKGSQEEDKWRGNISLNYSLNHNAPNPELLIDVRDDSDPLRIYLGNPNLRSAYSHILTFNSSNTRKYINFNIEGSYTRTQRQHTNAMSYDKATGVQTFRPQNIDGNWQATGSFSLSAAPMNSRISYSSMTTYRFLNSVDMVSTDALADATPSVVKNSNLNENVKLNYSYANITASLLADVGWQYATSTRQGFSTRSTFDLRYGFTLTAGRLPGDLSVSTDFTMYQRRGYDDHSMNDNSLVWNAQVSRFFGKDKQWGIRLSGHDILHQLSNVRRTLNAQGLSETWVNSLSSYLMLHVTFQFTKGPRRI